MTLSKVTIRRLPVVSPPIPEGGGRIHSQAGELAQIVNDESFRFLAYIEFQPNSQLLRGNHYHAVKTEVLYIIRGRLLARYQDIESGEIFETTLEGGDIVTIQPRCAHGYVPLEYTQAVELSSRAYEMADTIRHDLNLGASPADRIG